MGSRVAVLKDGVLVQVDSSQNLYERPRNIFVATFMGSPSMNILDAELERRDGVGISYHGDFIPLNVDPAAGLGSRKLKFGIRPEHVLVAPHADSTSSGIAGTVSLVEVMGDESIVTVMCERDSLRAKLRGFCRLRAGDRVQINAEPDFIHLFDAETSERIET